MSMDFREWAAHLTSNQVPRRRDRRQNRFGHTGEEDRFPLTPCENNGGGKGFSLTLRVLLGAQILFNFHV